MPKFDFTGWTDEQIAEFLMALVDEDIKSIMDDEDMWED